MDSLKKNDTTKANDEDKRQFCKYGANCFQKNPDHHKKFRHPPKKDADKDTVKKRKSPEGESVSTDAPKAKKPNTDTNSENNSQDTLKTDTTKTNETKTESSESEETISPNSKRNNTKSEDVNDRKENTETSKTENTDSSKGDSATTQSLVKENTKTSNSKTESLKTESNKIENASLQAAKVPMQVEDPYLESKRLIYKIFLVTMPNDFYKFYDLCTELKRTDPSTAFKIADLKLVGPYDVLNGLITKNTPDPSSLLTHWRYYYDPPEFQTIIKGNDKEGLHFGYWRDRPSSDPVFVATNSSNVSHKIKPVAENIFGAVTYYLEERSKKANPFEKTGLFNLLGRLKAYAKKYNITLETQTDKMKSREKNVVARTIHGAGIVCPYNKKSQLGYRELSVTDNQLLKIIKKIDDATSDEERAGPHSELSEVVRLATIAGDECDFGTCLELGHDLLSSGCVYVQNAALAVLSIAYNQLERQAFLKIVEAHMKNRKKGTKNSALPTESS